LRRGDEVLTTNQDYPRMIAAFSSGPGVRHRPEAVSLPVPAEDDDEIVDRFRRNVTPKTKLIWCAT